jgi:hypothetical protein
MKRTLDSRRPNPVSVTVVEATALLVAFLWVWI